jgi:brefeldin A-inhibited guanine nucleotide-exchange protein
MEQIQDPYQAYSETLIAAFEKLKKVCNARRLKEFRDMCEVAIQQVRSEKTATDLDANKYFPIFKIALDTKVTKALEHSLYYLQKLISHGFMTGNCPDITVEDPNPGRRLIDAIVDSVCACVQDRDDSVQLQVIKTILTIATCFNCEIHNKSLLECFRA